jgi:predicted transcriptional regulator
MTMTVKLEPVLEQRLRQRCAVQGVSASQVIREALVQWLDRQPDTAPSAHSLGADLFGRHAGPADLATRRKQVLGEIWADRLAARGG